MTTGSRIASYSQRIGSLSAGSCQYSVDRTLRSLALVSELEARSRAVEPDRNGNLPRVLDQDLIRDHGSADIVGQLAHFATETRRPLWLLRRENIDKRLSGVQGDPGTSTAPCHCQYSLALGAEELVL